MAPATSRRLVGAYTPASAGVGFYPGYAQNPLFIYPNIMSAEAWHIEAISEAELNKLAAWLSLVLKRPISFF